MQYLVENYKKNLAALEAIQSTIYPSLFTLEGNIQFDLIPGSNVAEMNIHDISNDAYMYSGNIAQSIADSLDELDEYSEYPYLFLFGIANGLIVKSLLNNKKLNRLFLFEPELEILFITLHLWDFSEDIYLKRLSISLADEFEFNQGINLFKDDGKLYAKTYKLLYSADYYEKFYAKPILNVNATIVRVFDFIITYAGNSIQDALQGIEHHIKNMKKMIEGPQFQKNFVKPQKFVRTGTVIMASSGPSLEKQLPILKEIQDHVTIICGESTLKILELNGVTPDICVSMERIIEVVRSFENVSDEYKKKVVFVRASLQHEAVFDVLKEVQDVLVMRPYAYNYIFGLDDYGYLCAGTSVANMAHELAYSMGYKTCIIIGQDLAYGADGKSHSKGHNFGEFQNKIDADADEITAYGGEGTVRTNFIWRLFLGGLIQTVAASKNIMLTINSTEGGARIDGTVEMTFQDAIDLYIDKSIKKNKLEMLYPSEQEIKSNLQKAKKITKKLIKEGEKLQKKVEKAFLRIAEPCKRLENLSLEEQLNVFSDKEIMEFLSIIETIRAEFDENRYLKNFFYEIGQSNIVHSELDISVIKVRKVHNPIENKEKALTWIYNHVPYLFDLAGTIHHICETIKKSDTLNCISEKQV